MNNYLADLHIHSVLSPCGELEMSPSRIISEAIHKGLDIIGLTDHNTTRQVPLVHQLGKENGIFVLCGAEVTSREEVHCLVFFEDFDKLEIFQHFLDTHLPVIRNNPHYFGYQVQVDRKDNVVYYEDRALSAALDVPLEELEIRVHALNGLFIPAHIDRRVNSLYSQLGFFPPDLNADALEISWRTRPVDFIATHPEISAYTITRSSDAHFPEDIGKVHSVFRMQNISFNEIGLALKRSDGREVIPV